MDDWLLRPVPFRFQLSDWTFFTASLPLQARICALSDLLEPVERPTLESHGETKQTSPGDEKVSHSPHL